MIVVFSKSNCADCKVLAGLIQDLEYTVSKVDCDMESGINRAIDLGIMQLPTVIGYTHKHIEVGRLSGYISRETLETFVKNVNDIEGGMTHAKL